MWWITTFGFFSVVQKPGDDDLTVRARSREDLLRLQESYLPSLTEPVQGAGTDYPFRSRSSHEAFADAMRRAAIDIDYSNFKTAVAKRMGPDRAAVYHGVWERLWAIQGVEATPRRSRRD